MSDFISTEGTILECHTSGFYRVECDIGDTKTMVLARKKGKMTQHRIMLVAGDRVSIDITPYDLSRGIITRRL